MGEAFRRRWAWFTGFHPAVYALGIVAAVTWMTAITLFVAMIRNIDQQIDREALDGTALTLLSALVALWAGFGAWAGRAVSRRCYLVLSLVALAGITLITGFSMLYMAFAGEPFAIPSNVAQLLILVTTALVSIAGTSVGYSARGYGVPPPPPEEEEPS